MKKSIHLASILILFFIFAAAAGAEWIGCDIPDPGQGVVESVVIVDSQPEVTVPYQLNTVGDAVLLLDIENIDTASIVVYFVNDQGRRSAASVPFVLKAKPLPPGPFRIVPE